MLREAEIEALSVWQNVMTYLEQFERQLLDEILVFEQRRVQRVKRGPLRDMASVSPGRYSDLLSQAGFVHAFRFADLSSFAQAGS